MKLDFERLNRLSADLGESFFLLDTDAFENNYRSFLGAFRRHYEPTQLAYSYKTNYTPRICRFVNQAGGYAEVVSGMEYELATSIGVDPRRIIFNGPCKRPAELQRALVQGAIVNVDGLEELAAVESIASSHKHLPMRVALRCNFPIGEPSISRFGFDVSSQEFKQAFLRLERHSNCELMGLHCHFSTRARRPESFALRTKMMLELVGCYFSERAPQLINLGGGFFSKMNVEMQKQMGISAPEWGEYASAIALQVAKAFPAAQTELILEPGSALVSDVQSFAARILDVKKVRSRAMAFCAGSIHNVKPTLHPRNMPMEILSAPRGGRSVSGSVDVVGYTCMEHDCLHAGYQGEVAVGDFALFPNVGAYTTVMKPPFIQGAPAIVELDNKGAGQFRWVRRREAMADIFATYNLEEVLA